MHIMCANDTIHTRQTTPVTHTHSPAQHTPHTHHTHTQLISKTRWQKMRSSKKTTATKLEYINKYAIYVTSELLGRVERVRTLYPTDNVTQSACASVAQLQRHTINDERLKGRWAYRLIALFAKLIPNSECNCVAARRKLIATLITEQFWCSVAVDFARKRWR